MCDAGASPRHCVRAEGFPHHPLSAPTGFGDPRSAAPCAELLSPARTISGSTRDTATTPSPRREASRFVWADEDFEDEELLPQAAACSRDASPARAGAAQIEPAARWKPNAYAPEFIPTTSMDCVMVGVASSCLPGRTPGLVGLGAAPSEVVAELAAKACAAGVRLSTGADSAGDAAAATSTPPSRRRRHGVGKARPPPLCTAPAADLGRQALASPRGCTEGPRDVPEATEEEWEHRAHIRMRAVAIGKESKEYRLLWETKKGCGHEASNEPKTPDPHDRSVSKRTWKFLLREWRCALEQECHDLQEGHGSVVSTEEWQSSVGAAPTEEPESSAAMCGDSDSESTSDI